MEQSLNEIPNLQTIENLAHYNFMITENSYQFYSLARDLYFQLSELIDNNHQTKPPKIIIAELEPVRFLAGFIAACAVKCPVFLCNPDWGKNEWEQVLNLVQPDLILGINHHDLPNYKSSINNCQPPINNGIMIPTGGSSGKIKFAIHTWETLTASVTGFREYFNLNKVNSFCVLPLYHVSGLMQFMRSFTTGGKIVITSFKNLENQQIPDINNYHDFFISLVPTQLQRLLQNPVLTDWLIQFKTILLGGAPAWEELLTKARFYQLKLAPTYGMTETASQIATLKPDDFLAGKFNSGKILPHAKINIDNLTGNINIQAQSLALGYYPQLWENHNHLLVDDIGFLDDEGYLHIIGRSSNKIISGGENIYPEEIEAVIKQTNLITDVCVIGVPDHKWGQVVTAVYVPIHESISITNIESHLKDKLSKFKIPKYWISLTHLPRNAQGKINREQLQKIALDFLTNLSTEKSN